MCLVHVDTLSDTYVKLLLHCTWNVYDMRLLYVCVMFLYITLYSLRLSDDFAQFVCTNSVIYLVWLTSSFHHSARIILVTVSVCHFFFYLVFCFLLARFDSFCVFVCFFCIISCCLCCCCGNIFIFVCVPFHVCVPNRIHSNKYWSLSMYYTVL